jgi:hypothetical protein
MKQYKVATFALGFALLGFWLAPQVQADNWNRKTTVTFSGPVEIPGVHLAGWGVLPAGTYVFQIVNSQSDRHIVQISSKDEKTVYATILAVPNYRLQATDKTVITFEERPAGQPEALRAWFYPGRNWGEEFVYPKAKAVELAKATNVPVLYTPAELPVEVDAPAKLAEAPIIQEMRRAPILAVQPSGEDIQLAQVVTPPPAERQEAAAVRDPVLPDSAGSLPLIAMVGFLALAMSAAFIVRAATRIGR